MADDFCLTVISSKYFSSTNDARYAGRMRYMPDEQEFLQQTSTFCIHSLLRLIAAGCLSLGQSPGSLKHHTHVYARAETVICITWDLK